tara:strand:+ start:799 stop:1296 length:498 start_codon:yes stop_codon:yes gene_type:complete
MSKQKLIALLESYDIATIKQGLELNKALKIFSIEKAFSYIDPEISEDIFMSNPEVLSINKAILGIYQKYGGKADDPTTRWYPVDLGDYTTTNFIMFINLSKAFPHNSSLLDVAKMLASLDKDIKSMVSKYKGITLDGEVRIDPSQNPDNECLIIASLKVNLSTYL